MSSPDRRRRALHKLAVSAAALAVCVLPTACDYPIASPPGAPTAPVDGQPGGGDTTSPVVVPVGNTSETSETSATSTSRTRTRDGRPRFTRIRTKPRTTTAAPVTDPASTTTTDPAATPTTVPTDPATTTTTAPPAAGRVVVPPVDDAAKGPNHGLKIIGRDCNSASTDPEVGSVLDPAAVTLHDGNQDPNPNASPQPKCVETAMGEVAPDDKLPSLLIVDAPKTVAVGQDFILKVSTRNLVRDRFLGAAAGGYYLESSFLNGANLQRGHFHTACRLLPNVTEAPDSQPKPAFFLATEDKGGGAAPDTVTINVLGATAAPGTLQCSSWAGDGSHRTPMMTRANQTPAFDSVRIEVGGAPAPAASPAEQSAAAADAAAQDAAQQQVAGSQRPDEYGDGSAGDGKENGTPPAAPAPDSAPPASSADSAAPAAPAADTGSAAPESKSVQERFKELREQQTGTGG
jgi:hypothetical protein